MGSIDMQFHNIFNISVFMYICHYLVACLLFFFLFIGEDVGRVDLLNKKACILVFDKKKIKICRKGRFALEIVSGMGRCSFPVLSSSCKL